MGQTLSHGVYLPNEGERNCYAGLASNWQILNTAVGAIAEKAPLVHTHTKSDITDFPAYGTTAGTICEGNDSRLSDARTPVAHTHGKADITDLFTSANTWSGEQTFSQTIRGNAATASAFDTAKSITLTGAVTGTVSGTNSWEIATVLKTGSVRTGGTVPAPYFKIASWEVAPNKYFGAILQIQNKCYPHNTATLTISVRTKTNATFQAGYSLLSNAIGVLPSEFILCYKEVTGKVLCELYYYTTSAFNGIRFSVISEGVGIQEGDSLFNTMIVYRDPSGIAALPSDYTVIQTTIGTYTQDFIPYSNNTYNLGNSTLKWKSLNGINPGALSLPDLSVSQDVDTTGWVYNGTTLNSVLLNTGDTDVTKNGWLYIRTNSTVAGDRIGVRLINTFAEYPTTIAGEIGFGHVEVFVPLVAGYKAYVFTNKAPTYIKFYPCLGNVPSGV